MKKDPEATALFTLRLRRQQTGPLKPWMGCCWTTGKCEWTKKNTLYSLFQKLANVILEKYLKAKGSVESNYMCAVHKLFMNADDCHRRLRLFPCVFCSVKRQVDISWNLSLTSQRPVSWGKILRCSCVGQWIGRIDVGLLSCLCVLSF